MYNAIWYNSNRFTRHLLAPISYTHPTIASYSCNGLLFLALDESLVNPILHLLMHSRTSVL